MIFFMVFLLLIFDLLQHLYWVEQPCLQKNTRKIDAIDSLVIASSKTFLIVPLSTSQNKRLCKILQE